ncbi:hypothetical protein AB0B40_18770 [Streptomyces sp. NPDC042638]|uniref:hypothetical protein n=1 Tax=Streptomyces sp. NPDC042638 TaxID=3154333 RepID=UPI0033E1DA9F
MEIAGHRLPEGSWWDREVIAWDAGQPRLAAGLARQVGGTPHLVAAFEADAGGREPVSCLVAAERLEILPGLVPRRARPGTGAVPSARDWPGPPLPTD